MESTPRILSNIKLRGHRKRKIAQVLRSLHTTTIGAREPTSITARKPISVVCISDTHNTRPELPKGDLLIHAGDLTENGSFDEIQAELNWLSAQSHKYKVFVAGNHDVLLDEDFLEKYPERRYGQTKTKEDLHWGSVIYLEDSCVTLEFPDDNNSAGNHTQNESLLRKLTVFGSPWIPQYGISAFQYRPDDADHWAMRLTPIHPKPDIVITHGPPKHHLDARDFHRAGCPYLGAEIATIRPKLAVFGHIHASYGREELVLDKFQSAYEDVLTGWAGWVTIMSMVALVSWAKLTSWFHFFRRTQPQTTVFVNASIVGGPRNEIKNVPIVVEL